MVGLVTFPLVRKALPLEYAKWQLAAAANAVAHSDWEEADKRLETAEKSSSAVRTLPDYWGVYLRLLNGDPNRNGSTDSLIDELREAISENSQNRLAGNWLVELLSEQGRFSEALECMKLTLGESGAQGAIQLNQLAYHRSLANVELDQALKDIDVALQDFPDEPSFLDTKAWIFYRQKRFEEALSAIQLALSQILPEIPVELREAPEDYDPAGLGIAPLGKLPKTVLKERFDVIAVIRFHRMKILEALGREEEALADYRAIRFWGIEPSEKLY
jgi:tetratricopeptide (TPR) repeat protein